MKLIKYDGIGTIIDISRQKKKKHVNFDVNIWVGIQNYKIKMWQNNKTDNFCWNIVMK